MPQVQIEMDFKTLVSATTAGVIGVAVGAIGTYYLLVVRSTYRYDEALKLKKEEPEITFDWDPLAGMSDDEQEQYISKLRQEHK